MKVSKRSGVSILISTLLIWTANATVPSEHGFQHPKYKFTKQIGNSIIPGRYMIEYSSTDTHNNDNSIAASLQDKFGTLSPSMGEPLYTAPQESSNFRSVHINKENDSIPASLHENFLQTLVNHQDVIAVYPVTYLDRPQSTSAGYFNQINPKETNAIQAHGLMQIDRLHKELHLSGKNVRICIIDTGVDYTHPALGGGFGPGYKIAFGASLVGDDFDPFSTNNSIPKSDAPPLDNCGSQSENSSGHGTHVAGILVGNDTSKGFIGVAPNATLGMWRVFGCNGGTSSEIIMKAMVEAEKARCDVINMSLGHSAPWSEQPHAVFAQKLANKGISVVVSNGNDGKEGAFTVTDPAGANDVLSVAAVSNSKTLGSLFSLRTSTDQKYGPYSYQVAPEAKHEIPDGEIVLGSISETLSACESDTIKDDHLNGKLAFVKQGSCKIIEQANNVVKSGAIGLVYFDADAKEILRLPYYNSSIPIAAISSVSGHELVSVLKNTRESKEKVHIHFERTAYVFESATANTIAEFSSIGPTNELDLKPSFGAVGSNVYSVLPHYLGGWGTKSGTSMAAPHVAGVAALMREAFAGKNISTLTMHEKLQNYAKLLNSYQEKNWLDSPLRQGSGLIQAYDAIKEPLHISPSFFSFNDTTSTTEYKSHTLTVTNMGADTVEYKIDSVPSISVLPYGKNNSDFRLVAYNSNQFHDTSIKINATVDHSEITLRPGESKQVVVSIAIPEHYNDNEQIMYGGFVCFKPTSANTASKQASIPYFGVLGSLYNLPALQASSLNLKDQHGHAYSSNDTYHYSLSDEQTAPTISFRLITPTRQLVIDMVDLAGNRIGYVAPSYNYAERTLNALSINELNPWKGQLTKGDQINSTPFTIQPGTYKIRWSALRMFGDSAKEEDWVVQTSCLIDIVP
ncbi:MAG: peptidase S8/S53 domain-containing protein [Benjaminiella poitrasii]|nr:MAG: peptidase S8/S53 domain-containing protein [Benjaminiella poitrasii]